MKWIMDAIDPGEGNDMLGRHDTASSLDLLGRDNKDAVAAVARVDRGIAGVAKSLNIDLSKMSRDQAVYLFNNIDAHVPEFKQLYKIRADQFIDKHLPQKQ